MVQKVQKGELQKKFSTLSSQLKVVRRPAWRQTNSAPRNTTSDGNRMAINITIATVASRSRATSENRGAFTAANLDHEDVYSPGAEGNQILPRTG